MIYNKTEHMYVGYELCDAWYMMQQNTCMNIKNCVICPS